MKNVYIIIGNGCSSDLVVERLSEKKYPHNFFIDKGFELDVLEKAMDMASEIWCYGSCESNLEYKMAIEKGCDIWQME